MPSRNTAPDAHTQNYSFKDERLQCALRSDIHEEASVKTKSKTITGLPRHPFGIIRGCGAP